MASLGVVKWLLVAARLLPLLVIVCLSAPAWLLWVFLPEKRQAVVLEMVRTMAAWACDAAGPETGSLVEQPQPPRDGKRKKAAQARVHRTPD